MPQLQITASQLVQAQDEATDAWHRDLSAPDTTKKATTEEAATIAMGLHRANFDLWHEEDKARDPNATAEAIVAVKRNIDRYNQRRNDFAEAFDTFLLTALTPLGLPRQDAPLHSETPGLMLDRLSILALKIYHTQEEIGRSGADAAHAERNRQRLQTLLEQRGDLATCLDQLWKEVLAGTRRFKLYRQLKMYNDPTLNPVLYGKNGPK